MVGNSKSSHTASMNTFLCSDGFSKNDISKKLKDIGNRFSDAFTDRDDEKIEKIIEQLNDEDDIPMDFSVQEVKDILIKAPCKGCGYDLLHPVLLSYGAKYLAEPLCHIFNWSIITRKFPTMWKAATIKPIPKNVQSNRLVI